MRNLIFVIFIFAASFSFSQQKENVIATAGKETITADEFKNRYELMPHLSKKWFNSDSVKAEFLYSIISEKLWAAEAINEGLDKDQYFLSTIKPIEKIYVRDALYKREVESKLNITKEDIQKAKLRSSTILKVTVLTCPDSQKVASVFMRLKNGISVDSIDCEKTDDEITFGKLDDEKVEDALYELQINKFTRPVKNRSGWFVFYLRDRVLKEIQTADSLNIHSTPKQVLTERRARKIGTAFLANFLKGVNASTDGSLFHSLAAKIHDLLKDKHPSIKGANLIFLGQEDMASCRKQFGADSLNMPFLKFKKDPVSLNDFLYTLDIDGFDVQKTDLKSIMNRLKTAVSDAIKNELLVREGYRRGLQYLPEVKNEIKLWRENLLAQAARNKAVKIMEIADMEAKEYYAKTAGDSTKNIKVKIVEIYTDSLETIQKIMNEVKAGRKFEDLAAIYNKREETKARNGEWDYIDPVVTGEIGKATVNLKPGEIFGPVNMAKGFSVIKLLERKYEDKSKTEKYEDVAENVKCDLAYKKMNASYNKKTRELADKYGVTLNPDLLKTISVMDINMFTYRYMGFGGRVTAVPYTTPMYDWSKEWKKGRPDLP